MKISHIAIWTNNLEGMREFYLSYFNAKSNNKYVNLLKGFESYFLSFDGEATLEIMSRLDISEEVKNEHIGLCHFAFTLNDRDEVCKLTERLRTDGYTIASEPRVTGDGFFESVILDKELNRIELVAQ